MGTMFDTTSDPKQTFRGLTVDAVAAYGNGSYANYASAMVGFPGVYLLKIDVMNQGIGNCGDFESGDILYAHAGAWAASRLKAGVWRPVLYFSVSSWSTVMQSLKQSGIDRSSVRIWTAHYTGHAHLCSSACAAGVSGTADATQWGSSDHQGAPPTLPPNLRGRNMDISETCGSFWGQAPVAHPFSGVLEAGSSGPTVKVWQQQMANRGWAIKVTGTYDAASENICTAFQREKRLTVTGRVDEPTWNAAWTAPITA